jgi:hypothetical protein
MDWQLTAFEAVVTTIVGAVMVGVGGWQAYHAVWWPKTSARIVRYWTTGRKDEPGGQRFYHPVVKFETADGRAVVAISSWGSWRRPWPVGRLVSVHYNPTNPRWVEIRCFANLWGIPLTLLGLTAITGLLMWFWDCVGCP